VSGVADTLTSPDTRAGTVTATSPAPARLLGAQIGHALRGFRRNAVMAVVTLAFPLAFLLLLGLASREAGTDAASGVAVIQLTAPIATVFAAMMAAYVMLPFQLAQARERGVLKRLRGTPLPMSTYVAGQVIAAIVVAALGTALMLLVAVAAFGLRIPTRALPALIVTFLFGVGTAAALGVAVAALVRGAETVMTVTIGSFLLLAFASGFFGVGAALPRALDVVTWWFPLRHFSTAFGAVFVPAAGSWGFAWGHLGALAGWGVVGVALATWGLRRPPRAVRGTTARRGVGREVTEPRRAPAGTSPSLGTLVWQQVRHANRSLLRQPSSAFFSIAFPVLFTIVVPYAFGNPVIDGVALPWLVTPAMAVFGLVVTAFINVPENVAIARDQGVLKRLRGTPLPASSYLSGRLGSIVWVSAVAVVAVFTAGWAVHGVTVAAGSLLPMTLAFLLGTVAFAALGLAIVSLVPDASAVPAVGLGLFLPLGFISDMLAFGMEMPAVLSTIGWLFPLKHLMHAVDAAFVGGTVAVEHLAVVLAWGVLGAIVAVRRFRWAPR
jgi:ABC-2 type transport system permease protein